MINQIIRHNCAIGSLTLLNFTRVFSPIILFAGLFFAAAFMHPVSVRAAGAVTLSATPTSRTVYAGDSTAYTININRDNYTGNVTLSASSLPSGATASFSPNPTTGKSSVLNVTTKTTTPAGTYTLKISGTAAGISIASINVTLIVQPAPSVTLSAFPDTVSIIAGQSATAEINITRTNYDGAVILAAQDLPEGFSITFDNNPTTGPKTTMRIYSHGLPHVWKDNLITIRATLREAGGRFAFMPLRILVNCGIDWVDQFGSNMTDSRHNDLDRNGDVTTDSNGNVYVASNTLGTVDPMNPNQGSFDVWVAKYNSTGQQLWVRQLGSTLEDFVTEVVVNSAGEIFIGGFSAGDMPGQINKGNFDFWIAKYDSNGNRLWVSEDGTSAQDGKFGLVIVPDGAGGGKLVTFTAERARITTYTFDSTGNLSRQSGFSQRFQETPYDLALGPGDTIYTVGTFTDLTTGAVKEFIFKYDSQGTELWRNTFGGPFQKKATRIALDSSGNAYVAGRIEPISPTVSDPNAWIAKYDASNGGNLWTKYEPSEFFDPNSPIEDDINAVGIDSNGDVIIAGMTRGILGERNGDSLLGGNDAWVARRKSSNGDLVWVKQFPVSDIDGFDALAFDNNKGIILSGYTVNFKSNIGFEDALLMRYVDSNPGTTLLPSVTSVTPGSATPGTTIRINGLTFFGITGVRFNGVPAAYTVVSPTRIDATVPPGATTGLITISKGCDSVSSPAPFTVLP